MHDHEPKSISSIMEFIDGFLSHLQVYPAWSIQEESLIKHHKDIENTISEEEDESSSGPHDEMDDF